MKKALTLILVALFSTVFALAQETVTYQPAQYPAGMGELHKFIAQNLIPDSRLTSQMEKEGIKEVTATFGLIINSKGRQSEQFIQKMICEYKKNLHYAVEQPSESSGKEKYQYRACLKELHSHKCRYKQSHTHTKLQWCIFGRAKILFCHQQQRR